MKKNIQELTPFEEALLDTIKEWNEEGINPLEDIKTFKEYANELYAVALNPIPCWQKTDIIKENGLIQTKMGVALVDYGYFVMLDDLVARLPRIID